MRVGGVKHNTGHGRANRRADRACGGYPAQSFGQGFRRHQILDDEVAGGERRRDGQAGEDFEDAQQDEIVH